MHYQHHNPRTNALRACGTDAKGPTWLISSLCQTTTDPRLVTCPQCKQTKAYQTCNNGEQASV